MSRRLFFTSVPKCGKNLIYSFLGAAGFARHIWRLQCNQVLHRAALDRFNDADNYLFPGCGAPSPSDVATARNWLVDELGDSAAPVVAHQHLLHDTEIVERLRAAGFGIVFVYRDPRAALVSALNWARKGNPAHIAERLSSMNDEDALAMLIDGAGGEFTPWADYFDAYSGWLTDRCATPLRFEDLIGPRGGGGDADQHRACARLAKAAGLMPDDPLVKLATERIFNVRAGTFYKGQIGAWRDYFTPRIASHYACYAGDLATRWGYSD